MNYNYPFNHKVASDCNVAQLIITNGDKETFQYVTRKLFLYLSTTKEKIKLKNPIIYTKIKKLLSRSVCQIQTYLLFPNWSWQKTEMGFWAWGALVKHKHVFSDSVYK